MLSTIGEYMKNVFIGSDLIKNEDGEYPINIETVLGPHIAKRIIDFEIVKIKEFERESAVPKKSIDL